MKIGQYRDRFEVPDGIAYFNTAYNSPLLRSSREALEQAAGAKSRPWERTSADFFDEADQVRSICSRLLGGAADDYALIGAASYGVSTAARILEPRLGASDKILVMAQEFPSNVLPWRRVSTQTGAEIRTVPTPPDGDWTSAIIGSLDRSTKVASLVGCHWTNGAAVDLVAVGAACRQSGTVLVLDLSQSLGAVPLDLDVVQPDFMVAAGYKWLLCPYGFAIMYVAPKWHGERPLEETWLARGNAGNFAKLVEYCDEYRPGARRFDVGETCVTTVLPGAIAALEQLEEWGVGNIFDLLRHTNRAIVERIEPLGYRLLSPGSADRHMFGVALPGGLNKDVVASLSASKIHVSLRGDSIRISPHLHVGEADIDQLVGALEQLAGQNG
jgi:selenocysteine lyase/cysteine desulfurase